MPIIKSKEARKEAARENLQERISERLGEFIGEMQKSDENEELMYSDKDLAELVIEVIQQDYRIK